MVQVSLAELFGLCGNNKKQVKRGKIVSSLLFLFNVRRICFVGNLNSTQAENKVIVWDLNIDDEADYKDQRSKHFFTKNSKD